jgi:hypothetical protein
VGLAAWIMEKWRSWSDCHGDPVSRFGADFLLTVVTLYVTGTIISSMRDYYDNRRWQGEPRLGSRDWVRVPTAVAVFPRLLIPEGQPPREWAERLYDIRRWTMMPRGGHFAPPRNPNSSPPTSQPSTPPWTYNGRGKRRRPNHAHSHNERPGA